MIGVLAIQGGFAAHINVLRRLGVPHREVRLPADLAGLQGLIIPGGESTTMLKLLQAFDMKQPLQEFAASGRPILGTCAGAILMAERVTHPEQESLGWIPVTIERNAYGSQRESFQTTQACEAWEMDAFPALFIRAPRFREPRSEVEVLTRLDDHITGVRYKHFTAITYHPELTEDDRFHQAWLTHQVHGAETEPVEQVTT
ncbi:pyridoxal 5'-phosphate synthase glutaminase subunit PdxT [Sulfidibacter corallicola]|uniref:Pyridoxal 5'-phosphate synthase glutaminase subunit PdxT n=1 Tax=Sulfidibacter corallicola TaxID=2818388 RepID=A0A8A4TV51_SULCO|nr:pyridoxal 5'-phosphate synthase glutaminase subunit PdxT [Sulfidibacter corallicola]QTD53028.1 pyridoxal 5'-phosphate synthase glutaminase subunit PdxT [Sulfidibacter corallicola]